MQKLDTLGFTELSRDEMVDTDGGILLPVVIAIGIILLTPTPAY